MRARGQNFAAVHDEDFVRVFHGRHALSDYDFGRIGDFVRERLSD